MRNEGVREMIPWYKPSDLNLDPQSPHDTGVIAQLSGFTLCFCQETKGDTGELQKPRDQPAWHMQQQTTEVLSQTRWKAGTHT